ncbi:MAG: tRNA (guanosine(37)-N1)-methyltransferase TrmD [Acidimicrobiia bacterium]|nr:tRNA (guanosine(37)-N1)-methyltransferase TrmD [bacterium]MXX65185.1 tRNA (guanosine(37)-N1)-methyltransferase TrmD [Acidimicrobiia bacterium]MYD04215.1 tRNA (guanosine(37)-N1)-methyltransferase TrmD [Acidimicrobiia bacterium]MYH56406.1 tRNA (guanosine(37)-N1)-methyltransferase TrmD [Acidimicrobiia bacterium]
MLDVAIITLFPEFFDSPTKLGVVKKATEIGVLNLRLINLRDFGVGNHRQVDDAPFGGGAGMVLMPGPLTEALSGCPSGPKVLLTPAGQPLDQATLDRWAGLDSLTLVCGRYEGVDERFVEEFIDEEVTLGDYVLAGGDVAALAVLEGLARLLPGVLGNRLSLEHESFRGGLLEEPQYTRPALFRGRPVPEVLISGDHARIEAWREEQRLDRTRRRRPDLLDKEPTV